MAVAASPSVASDVDRRWVPLALAAVYVIWGSTYFAMRVAVEAIPPFFMASVRYLAMGLVMLAALRARGLPWPTRREWQAAAPVAFFMFVLGNGTVAMAERRISSGVAAVVCGTMPLWAAALGRFIGEKTSAREWAGLALGFSGVAVLSFGGELRADLVSTVLILIAPLGWAIGSLWARKAPMAKGPMASATQMVVGGAVMGLVSPLLGERWPMEVPSRALGAWLYLAVFGSVIAYTAYTYLLRTTSTAVATSYSYVNPPIAVLMGAALGHEALGPETFASVGLVIAATVLVIGGKRG